MKTQKPNKTRVYAELMRARALDRHYHESYELDEILFGIYTELAKTKPWQFWHWLWIFQTVKEVAKFEVKHHDSDCCDYESEHEPAK